MADRRGSNDMGRISRRPYGRSGLSRQTRLTITLGVTAALILALGVGLGFALGRASAPEPEPAVTPQPTPAVTIIEEPTSTLEASETTLATQVVEAEEPQNEPPPKPKQLAPKDGAVIDASRVDLKWSEVEDDSGEPVTYAFEIQDRASDGSYGKTQVIKGLNEPTYSARVLYVKRRWRAWAVDADGEAGAKTKWRYYIHKAKPKPKAKQATPEPSDETT